MPVKRVFTAWKAFLLVLERIATNVYLNSVARRTLLDTYPVPAELQRDNEILQRKLSEIFRRYDLCERCVSHCCHSRVNRFDIVDSFLMGKPLESGLSPWHRVGHLTASLAGMMHQLAGSASEDAPTETCIHHSPTAGCMLPVGERPSMCISGVCWQFIREFREEDLAAYRRLLTELQKHRRRTVRVLTEALKRPGAPRDLTEA